MEGSRSTDKQPDENCPEGTPEVNDGRARHVDAAFKLGRGFKANKHYAYV
jgi:hypothetical protein